MRCQLIFGFSLSTFEKASLGLLTTSAGRDRFNPPQVQLDETSIAFFKSLGSSVHHEFKT